MCSDAGSRGDYRPRWRRIVCGMAAGLLGLQLLAVAWLLPFGGRFLEAPANEAVPADLIVILGGCSMAARIEAGARLFREKLAPRILLTGFAAGNDAGLAWQQEWRVNYLGQLGVPPAAITPDHTAKSSWMEIALVRIVMEESGWHRVLVISDPPHLRRLSLVAAKTFAGTGLDIRLIPSRPNWWDAGRWWTGSTSARFVILECIKLGYYYAGERI